MSARVVHAAGYRGRRFEQIQLRSRPLSLFSPPVQRRYCSPTGPVGSRRSRRDDNAIEGAASFAQCVFRHQPISICPQLTWLHLMHPNAAWISDLLTAHRCSGAR